MVRGRSGSPSLFALITSLLVALHHETALSATIAAGADTLRMRFELGAGTDVSNEAFYEESYGDTTFSGRRLVSTPETRVAGVASMMLDGTRSERQESYNVRGDLSLGDIIRRGTITSRWRRELSTRWQLDVAPRLEARRDRSFGRDLEEARATGVARLRRSSDDDATRLEIGGRGDFNRSRGTSAALVLDRNAGGGFIALERTPLFGREWRIGYSFTARAFPDSTVRDHFEHGVEARFRHGFGSAAWIALETDAERRQTIYSTPNSRDRFASGHAAAESQWPAVERLALRTRLELEALHYDRQDSILYFNYQVARGTLGVRLQVFGPWTFTVGPRVEALFSRLNPAEAYQEFGGVLECEFLGGSALWSVSPAAGWRNYDGLPHSTDSVGLHSSYAFYELGLLADQALPAALHLRANGIARLERHIDASQDARSLYFSLDVRRLF